jgi:hypothetical protein
MFESDRKYFMATPAQIEANRANAQLSSGPSSPEGKAKCSHNALKTGLTGRTILLPSDDVAAYQNLVALTKKKFDPSTDEEKLLVQSIADTEWRLLRIPTLEAGLYALGRNELAGECAFETDPQARAAMLEALIFRTYRKDLSNLALQESRLNKQLEKHKAQLNQLQQDRESLALERRNAAMLAFDAAKTKKEPFNAAEFGFEFSEDYISARHQAFRKRGWEALPQFDRAWKAKIRSQAA